MTEAATVSVVAALIAAVPPTIVAWLAFRQAQENSRKSTVMTGKVNEIHTLANSNLATVTSALAVATEKISGLEKMVAALAKKRPAK